MKNNKVHFSTFVPERLKEAREARGLTQEELSAKIELSHQAISKYEKNKAIPSTQVLEQLSKLLSVPTHFFLKPKETDISADDVVFFRSRAAATKKSKLAHANRLKWLIEIHRYLETYLDFPTLDIPKYLSSKVYAPIDFEEIDEIAIKVRKHWGLGNGPISNVLLLLEKKGAIVARASFSDYKIDACSVWEPSSRPYIFLGSDKTAAHSRFDISHELGHLVLHSNLTLSEFNNKENYKRIEKEAHRFASAFLLPASSFGNEVMFTSIEHFAELKKRWKVSIQAMAYRAQQLGLISEFQHINIRKRLAANHWLQQEPLDAEIPFEEPAALKQAIELIVQHNAQTKSAIEYEIGLESQ